MISKNKKEMRKKRESIFIIANLLISILAIAFMIGLESESVSGNIEAINLIGDNDPIEKTRQAK